MDLIVLGLAISLVAVVYLYLTKDYNYWAKRGIPQASGALPAVGHLARLVLLKDNFNEICNGIYSKYRNHSMVGFYDKCEPALIVRDPELVKTVLQSNFQSFHDNMLKVDPKLDPLLARNPFFTYGEVWLTGRKRLTYAFSSMRLKMLADTVRGVSKKFDDFLAKQCAKNQKVECELKELFSRYTGEVVANAGFGAEGFCFDDNKISESFLGIGKKIFEPGAFNGIMQNILFFFPNVAAILRVPFIPKSIDNRFRKIVKDIMGIRKSEGTPRKDFIQLMSDLEATEHETISEDSLMAHIVSFFIDGFETSSLTLTFVGFQLAAHPHVQEKLREEVVRVLKKYDGLITYEGIKEMTYMDQVISESQRMHPIVATLGKICTESFELKGNDGLTCRVEPGTKVIIPVKGLHRDSQHWEDPEIFDPDRFSDQKKNDIKKFTFLPFGEGPRICVGMRMAILQMKSCLSTLVSNYSMELSPRTQTPLKLNPRYFMSSPVGGVWVYLRPLNRY